MPESILDPSYVKDRVRRHENDPAWIEAYNKLKQTIQKGQNVYISGEHGTGKTTLLQSVYNETVPTRPAVLTHLRLDLAETEESTYKTTANSLERLAQSAGLAEIPFQKRRELSGEQRIQKTEGVIATIISGGERPILFADKFYPPGYSGPPTPQLVKESSNLIKRLINKGLQVVAAGREPLGKTFPALEDDFQEIRLKSKQVVDKP